jgi:putative flippase GtrA
VEISVLVGANLVATAVRFLLLRGWVFRDRSAASSTAVQPAAIL